MELTGIRRRIISNAPHLATQTGNLIEIKRAEKANVKRFEIAFDQTEVQDLHGYAKPWIGGEGKNLIDIDTTTGTALSRGITAKKNADGSITVKGKYTNSNNGFIGSVDDAVTLPVGEYIISGSTTGWYDSYGVQLYIDATYGYVRGNPVTITLTEETSIPLRIHFIAAKAKDVPLPAEGLTFYPMIRLSSATADFEPYENYCPITGGISGCTVSKTGKNMAIDLQMGRGYDPDTGVEYNFSSGARTSKVRVDFTKYGSYVLSTDDRNPCEIMAWDNNGNYVGRTIGNNSYPRVVQKTSFSRGNGNKDYDKIETIGIYFYQGTGMNINTVTNAHMQLEVGNTPTAYETPVVSEYSISWLANPGVIFNGNLNMLTGILHVDNVLWTFTGTENWTHKWGTSVENGVLRLDDIPFIPNSATNVLANFSTQNNRVTFDYTVRGYFIHRTSEYLNIRNNMCALLGNRTASDVVTEWKALLAQRYAAGKPYAILMRGVDQTYQLTAQQLKLFTGRNFVWSDHGTTTLKFWTH